MVALARAGLALMPLVSPIGQFLQAQTAPSLVVEWSGGSTTLTAAQLSALPRDSVRMRFHDGPEHLFTGPRLATLLRQAGVKVDSLRGRGTAQYLLVEATDGYRSVFSLGEIADDIGAGRAILADRMDGAPLPASEGPFRMVVPGDRRPARSVRQVARVVVDAPPRESPAWVHLGMLQGCWEARRADRRIIERWERVSGGVLKGDSRTWVGDRQAGGEQLVLSPDSTGTWVYAADPDTQRPASFKATAVTDTLLVFENPGHDFPQRIGYRPAGVDSLYAWIEGFTTGAGRRVDFAFGRIRCSPTP
jgi:hypothetical protein